MVLLMITSLYPAHLADVVGKKYIEIMKKYPIDKSIEKQIVPVAVHVKIDGIHVVSITTVKPGKFKEAMDVESKRMLEFGQIEGFKYSIDTMYDAVEAMGLLGMEAPV